MKPNTFAGLALVTLVAAVVAIGSYVSQNRLSRVPVSGAHLFPGLPAQAQRIARLELQQGDTSLTLARDKETWSLADRAGYPAKTDAVRALLVKLAAAELIEPKTRAADRYALLELEEPSGKDAKSRLVRVLDDKGGMLAQAIVGKKRYDAFGANKSGTYVRKPGDPQTWLSNADLVISTSVRDWVQQPNVLEVPTPKISALTIEIPSEEPLKITRDASTAKHSLVGLAEGKKLKQGSPIDGIVRAAGSIDLEDVRKPAGSAPPAGDVSTVKLEADGGLVVTMKFIKQGEDYWLDLAATGEGDSKAQAEEIIKRAQGWQFKVPAAKAQSILKRRADLIEAS